jgi:YD repeat-containing protein
MYNARPGLWLWAALLVLSSLPAHAQSGGEVTPEDEYKKLIKVDQDIQPLGATPFGENISLYDGTLSFEETDISLAGNGPLLQLSRSFSVENYKTAAPLNDEGAFADWELDIPRLETDSINDPGKLSGWLVNSSNPQARCSQFGLPRDLFAASMGDPWGVSQWWHGYHLIIPGEGSQELLQRRGENTLAPTAGVSIFPIVTKQNWMIKCGVLTDDQGADPGGEGFVALAPDGTTYTFAHLVYRPMSPISVSYAGAKTTLGRNDALMLVTKVQDRFGNTLTYSYNGSNLIGIRADDGRQLQITYVQGTSRISSVVLQPTNGSPRTWSYHYTNVRTGYVALSEVDLPDGSSWHYDLSSLRAYIHLNGGADCDEFYVADSATTGTITHPSGLIGTFTVIPMMHERSNVPDQCSVGVSYMPIPDSYAQISVIAKTFSGAGLAVPQRWTYNYTPAWSLPTTDVLDPDGHDVRYTFSNSFDVSEGQLQRTDYYSDAVGSTILRSVINQYADPSAGPWPSMVGIDLQDLDNPGTNEELAPLQQREILENGNTYIWHADAFNAYTQVTQTTRSSFAGEPTITEQTSYLNDPNLWVLGLPQNITNVGTGEVESANTYDSNDTLLTRSRFGELLMSYTFNGAGQLASFTDGNNHTTSLGNYKRGIPQTIGYPDSTSETLAVDDFGQISAITDQAGHTTSYGYDNIGRITGISYPGGDEVAWLPTSFAYSFVTGPERGLAANHWKRTTTTGNAVSTTYFDAMLRPVLSDSAIGSIVQTSTLATYDSKSQKVFSSYPSASALTFSQMPTVPGSSTTYDALERVTQVQQSSELGTLTSSTAYLPGARRQVTDPKGNVTITSYQVFDSPAYDAPILVQAPAGITQTIVRDVYGNPQSITQSGLYGTESDSVTKTLTYDSYHRLCRTTEPESGSEVMAYDAANNLAWSAAGLAITGTGCGQEQVAAAAQTSRTYDAMNRVTMIQPPAGTQSTQYHYTPLGQPDNVVSGISTWSGVYNFRGMLTGESLQLIGQSAWGIGYAHDAYGSLSMVHYPDGENVSYAPDALGRPTQVGSYATGIGYFPNGQVSQFVYANGTGFLAAQNARQLLSNFSYGPGSTAQVSEDLSYDQNGNITTVADLASGPRNKSFGYDALNRLTSANAAGLWGSQAYTYDALNNLRSLQTGSQTSIYHYDSTNKLGSISSGASTLTSYLYDTRGNVTGKNATTLVFDQKNQLTQIAGGGSYAYDASGRRVSKTVGGTTTYYFYNQVGQLMYQWAPDNALSTSFVYLGSKLVGDNETIVLGAPATIGFDANPSNGSYTVHWGAVAGATSYVLQESANGGAWTTVYSGSAASAALSGRPGGGYVYRVEGCIGTTCGAFTSSATLGVTPTLPTVTVPTGIVNGAYTVSWTAPVSATTYSVQERLNGGAWTTVASNTSTTSISRPGTASGSYTYQVSASNAYGTRGWAPSAAVTVNTNYGVVPSPLPSLTVPAANATGSITVSWSAATPVTQYTLQQSINGGGWSTVYAGLGTSVALAGLADGSYAYRLQACNDTAGNSVCTAWVGGGPMVVTHPPTTAPVLAVPASSADGNYTVSWSGVPGPVSYTLQESVNGGGWSTVQANGTTSWSASGRSNGSYAYRVQACNVGGCGPWSGTGSTTVLLPPAAPASISIPATSNGPVAVNWAASATATSYTLQHADYGVTGWSTIYTGGATGYTQPETVTAVWIYQVQACNAGGCSAFRASSGGVTVTIPPASAPSLSVPASSSTGSYTVSWGSVGGATTYTLQEQVNGGGWTTVQATSATSESFSGKGNGSYGYRVQACNTGGCGPWSSTGTVTVALAPAAPATVTAPSYVKGTPYTISWSASAGSTSYNVRRTDLDVGSSSIVATTSNTSLGILAPIDSQTLQYAVQACNASGCSDFTNAPNTTSTDGKGSPRVITRLPLAPGGSP